VTHAELLAEVGRRCDARDLWWRAERPDVRGMQGHPGWVDVVILGPGGGVLAELKSDGGTRTPAQRFVAGLIRGAGWSYRLWHPSDLAPGGDVDAVLDSLG
jgi:hypothetical protein